MGSIPKYFFQFTNCSWELYIASQIFFGLQSSPTGDIYRITCFLGLYGDRPDGDINCPECLINPNIALKRFSVYYTQSICSGDLLLTNNDFQGGFMNQYIAFRVHMLACLKLKSLLTGLWLLLHLPSSKTNKTHVNLNANFYSLINTWRQIH